MSKFTEYLALIPKGIANPKEVLSGFLNAVKQELKALPEDKADEIIRRRLICAGCPEMSENAKQLTGYKSKRTDAHCTLCSCPIKTKTASLDSICGAHVWNESHPELEPKEVKWFAYESK